MSVKKALGIWLGTVCICAVVFVVQWRYFTQREKEILAANVEEEISEVPTTEAAEEKSAEEKHVEDIFADNNVADLGYDVIAYCVPNGKNITHNFGYFADYFTGDNYIAVHLINREEIQHDEVFYLPNIYGKIAEMRMEKSGELYIRYASSASDDIKEVSIPLNFSTWTGADYLDSFPSYRYKDAKLILSVQEGLKSDGGSIRQLVWSNCFLYDKETYEISFERVSPVYDYGFEAGGLFADYCLRLKAGDGNVLSEQVIINYPVAYEEVYWFTDFSGDGFMDIAFAYAEGWANNGMDGTIGSDLLMLIWNSETGLYERKEFPLTEYEEHTNPIYAYPVWNEELSCVVLWVNRDKYGRRTKNMYSFLEGEWRKVKKLQAAYSDSALTDEGEYVYLGYCEMIYSENGDVIDEISLESDTPWIDEESYWSDDNERNIKLYPGYKGWDIVSGNVGGISIDKVVRKELETEQTQWQIYIQPDMPEPFADVLRQYEQYMNADVHDLNDEEVWDKINTINGEWHYLYDELCRLWWSRIYQDGDEAGKDVIRYSLKDLTNDGFPELIMGYHSCYDDITTPEVIYYYSATKGVVMECNTRYFTMSIYEDGIVEYISAGGAATITYCQFKNDTEEWLEVEILSERGFPGEEDGIKYFKVFDSSDRSLDKPISEAEFLEIKSRYTKQLVELEWTSLVK